MALTPALPGDVRALAELWSQAFPGERSVTERIRNLELGVPYGGLESVLVERVGNRIVAALKALRLTQHLHGTPLPMMGLAAVAVAADARRRGLGARICREALRIARDRGDVLSALYPFRPSFYRALGWGLAGRLHAHVFAPGALPLFEERSAVRSGIDDDRGPIAACYARVAERSNGPIERSARAWSNHLGPGVATFVYERGDAVRGYALARLGGGRRPTQRLLYVRELIAEDDVARRGIIGCLASLADQWSLARYDARPDERFEELLDDPRPPRFAFHRALYFPVGRLLGGPMLRVLDVPAALRALGGRTDRDPVPAITVEVVDAELPENLGPWRWVSDEVRQRPGGTPALRTDASTFAQIAGGELTVSAAQRIGRAETDGDIALLDRAFEGRERFWLPDEF